jgi:hypothetical protein
MSYGTTVADAVHQADNYAGKILSGDKAADLPVIKALGRCAAQPGAHHRISENCDGPFPGAGSDGTATCRRAHSRRR